MLLKRFFYLELVLLFFSFLPFSLQSVPKHKSQQTLVDCGWSGITEVECVGRTIGRFNKLGCIFNTSTNPQCYHKPDAVCLIPDEDEMGDNSPSSECGPVAISRESCEAKGCCFESRRKSRNISPCFHPRNSECYFSAYERKDCGFSGITRAECELRKCCFDPKPRGPLPQCFVSKAGPIPVSSGVGFSLYLMFGILILVTYWTYCGGTTNDDDGNIISTQPNPGTGLLARLASFFAGPTPTELKTEKYIL